METTLVFTFTGAVIGVVAGVVCGVVLANAEKTSYLSSTGKTEMPNERAHEQSLVACTAAVFGTAGAVIGGLIGAVVEYPSSDNVIKNKPIIENISSTVEIERNKKFIISTPRLV